MAKQPVEIEVVIDRSGSMEIIRQDAIGGYNAWLEAQQKLKGKANLTLTLFDHERITTVARDIKLAQPLDLLTYVPRGSTALNDAVGAALTRLNTKNPDKAILVILTDGMENASKEFTTAAVKDLVTKAQAKGWQVVYLSADINAFANAAMIGVKANTTMSFTRDAAGTQSAYQAACTLNSSYRGK